MYDFRRMTPEERLAVVEERKRRGYPWHRPPHPETAKQHRIVSAACYEHQHRLDSNARLAWFEDELLSTLKRLGVQCAAWCVLPNHYHLLVLLADYRPFSLELGRLHGRTSREMNRQDGAMGRKIWCKTMDRTMRSLAHFLTTINYIHHSPVKQGYVEKWQEWPYSSVHWHLETKGRDWMLTNWKAYPLKGYGEKWDA
jgi:putative transposase